MMNKKISTTDLQNRIAKADVTCLESRKQFVWFWPTALAIYLGVAVITTCSDGSGSDKWDSCGKSSSNK